MTGESPSNKCGLLFVGSVSGREIWAALRLSVHVQRYVEHRALGDKWVLVREHLQGYTDLYDLLEERGRLSEEETREIVRGLVRAVEACAAAGVDHGDLREENVLYNPLTGDIKLTNFSQARPLSTAPRQRGPALYLPPENYLKGRCYAPPATVWAIGCIAFSLLTGTSPGPLLSAADWTTLSHSSRTAYDFVHSALQNNTRRRIQLKMLRHHTWISQSIEECSNLSECSSL